MLHSGKEIDMSVSMITIQKASVKDAQILVELGMQTFTETFAADNTPEDMNMYLQQHFTIEKIKAEFQEEGSVFLLARDGSREVGYAKIRLNNKPKELRSVRPMEIERLYCIKEYHGRKVGTMLMQFCLDLGKRKNCDVTWLGVWEHNHKAIAFYQKWGFEKFGQHIFTLGTDPQTDLLMRKKMN